MEKSSKESDKKKKIFEVNKAALDAVTEHLLGGIENCSYAVSSFDVAEENNASVVVFVRVGGNLCIFDAGENLDSWNEKIPTVAKILGSKTLGGSAMENVLREAGINFASFPQKPTVRESNKIEADERGLLRIFATDFPFFILQDVCGINYLELYGWSEKNYILRQSPGFKKLISVRLPSCFRKIMVDTFSNCFQLEKVEFAGTKAQWQEIKKGADYLWHTKVLSVSCTDGDADGEEIVGYTIDEDGCISLNCMYKHFAVPEGVRTIEAGIDSLEFIQIPQSVRKIEAYAFGDCISLESIEFSGTTEQWYSIEKGEYWDGEFMIIPAGVVKCTDGEVKI